MDVLVQNYGTIKQILCAVGVFVLVAAISFFFHWWKLRGKKKEKEQHTIRRMQEEALDRALENPKNERKSGPFEKKRRPFQVEYSNGENSGKRGSSESQMFQLIEITELSQRKYIFRCNEQVRIGSQFGSVTILPENAEQGQVYCQIFFYQQANYLRSTGPMEIVIKRKGKQAIVSREGIKIQSGDCFMVGKTSYQIEFISS